MVFITTTKPTRFIRHEHACLGVAGPEGLILTAGDSNDSLLWSRNGGQSSGKTHAWSPYGKGETGDGLPGFNGERPDPVRGSYHLGNGYRAYNPVLRRFNCPDNLSPFGAGGINPYAYCLGDPVNRTDPTGHISWQGILGIVTGAIGLGLSLFTADASITAALSSVSRLGLTIGLMGVAADVTSIASGATEDVNPEASAALGWVSMATGIAGMASGISLAPKSANAIMHVTEGTKQRLGNILETGLSGRGATVAARRWATANMDELLAIAFQGHTPENKIFFLHKSPDQNNKYFLINSIKNNENQSRMVNTSLLIEQMNQRE